MKSDERTLFDAVREKQAQRDAIPAPECYDFRTACGTWPRECIAAIDMNHKRGWYILEKWTDKGWYEYGVTIDLGWLTPAGIEAHEKLTPPCGKGGG